MEDKKKSAQVERKFIQAKALVSTGCDIKQACEMVGLPRTSYYWKKKKARLSEQESGMDHSA